MALIVRFSERPNANIGWRSEVECGFSLGTVGDRRILHLETYGSNARNIPGKVSESLELDEEAAKELVEILRRAFPGLER